jgi:hypothetical protein
MEPKLCISTPSKFAIIQPKKFDGPNSVGANLTSVLFALALNNLGADMHYFGFNLASRIKNQISK